MDGKEGPGKETLREFEENPFNPGKHVPEDVIRLFYAHDVPVMPVVSKRGLLLGILRKEDVVAELSDMERTKNLKIDQFITRLARKMTADEVLAFLGQNREFVTINIFGEEQGRWSRVELFAACESPEAAKTVKEDIDRQKEKQVMEWMIYLILEHIPRAIFAVNREGKTIFYNGYFEDLFRSRVGRELEVEFVEESLKNPEKNEIFSRKKAGEGVYFLNKEMNFYYEKTPLVSDEKTLGFLFYCDRYMNEEPGVVLPGVNMQGLSLGKVLEAVERGIIVHAIKEHRFNLDKVEKELRISRQSLVGKIKKYGIKLEKDRKTPRKK
jgi:transcriptional regulator with PAS, ATPase and Fis domain